MIGTAQMMEAMSMFSLDRSLCTAHSDRPPEAASCESAGPLLVTL